MSKKLSRLRFLRVAANYSVNAGKDIQFTIASKQDTGGIHTHTTFMTYDEMNAYLLGYSDALAMKYKVMQPITLKQP